MVRATCSDGDSRHHSSGRLSFSKPGRFATLKKGANVSTAPDDINRLVLRLERALVSTILDGDFRLTQRLTQVSQVMASSGAETSVMLLH